MKFYWFLPHPRHSIVLTSNFNASILLQQSSRCGQLLENDVGKSNLIRLQKSWLELVVPLQVETLDVTNAPHCMLKILVREVAGKWSNHHLRKDQNLRYAVEKTT